MQAHYGEGICDCPAAGMTLPELVVGGLDRAEEEIWENIEKSIVESTPLPRSQPMTAPELAIVVGDMHGAQAHIMGLWRAKTDYIRRLPVLFVGLAVAFEGLPESWP